MFSALGQGTRLAAFKLLIEAGPKGMPASEIAETVEANLSTLSRHLGQLEAAGLVTSERQSRKILYTINWPGVDGLLQFIIADCCKRDASCCVGENCCE